MIKIKPTVLSLLIVGMVSSPAFADEFDGGINMTNSGPVGTLNGGGPGTSMIGGGDADLSGGSQFNFDMGSANSGGPFARGGGGVSGPAGRSQARPGDRSHQADRTNGNDYGNTLKADDPNEKYNVNRRQVPYQPAFAPTIRNLSRFNLLTPNSFDTGGVPSGQWNFGFNGSGSGGAPLRAAGWMLPKTSTGSVDINTVSP